MEAGEGGRGAGLVGPLVDHAAGAQPDARGPELADPADLSQRRAGPVRAEGAEPGDVEVAGEGRAGDAVEASHLLGGESGHLVEGEQVPLESTVRYPELVTFDRISDAHPANLLGTLTAHQVAHHEGESEEEAARALAAMRVSAGRLREIRRAVVPKLPVSLWGKTVDRFLLHEELDGYGLLNAVTNVTWHDPTPTAATFEHNEQASTALVAYALGEGRRS